MKKTDHGQSHGTARDLEGGGFYSDAEKRINTGGSTSGNIEFPGVSTATTPITSDYFAALSSEGRSAINKQTPDLPPLHGANTVHPSGFQPQPELIDAHTAQRTYGEGARSLPLVSRWDKLVQLPVAENSRRLTNHRVSDAFEDLGADGVLLTNYTAIPGYGPHQTLQVKSPEQLRSRFAAFGPARKNERDLLASLALPVAGAGLMAASAFSPEEAQAAQAAKEKDPPLEDAYSPVDLLLAGLMGGGGFAPRAAGAALDPFADAATDYAAQGLMKAYDWWRK